MMVQALTIQEVLSVPEAVCWCHEDNPVNGIY